METTTKSKVFNLIILDKSGSMNSIRHAAISGFNETLASIRKAQENFAETQEHYVTLLPFCRCSTNYVYQNKPIDHVHDLSLYDYQPCCGTPLYDAMGRGINDMLRISQKEELCSVVVTVITDGMENASREYSGRDIKALVERMQKEYGWNFSYIGTNQDVERVSADLSISNFMTFNDDEDGMREAWARERKSKYRMYSRMDRNLKESSGMNFFQRRQRLNEEFSASENYIDINRFRHRITPEHITHLEPGQIFVFGSNKDGQHIGGASRYAVEHFGAIMGQGEGLQGQSYAIPTVNDQRTKYVENFILFAREHPEMTFLVTRVGCGNAGLPVMEMARLFAYAVEVENIWLPIEFWRELI